MRCLKLYWLLAVGAGLLAGCEDEPPLTPGNTNPVINTPPKVDAGQDIYILLPASTVTLTGSVTDAENNIRRHFWQQIYGPAGIVLNQPDSLQTVVTNLSLGNYEFELTGTDEKGLFAKDTVAVFIRNPALPGSGEVLFADLQWNCPMGCTVAIGCIPCFVPHNKPFKVFLREGATLPWLEVVPEAQWTSMVKYVYGVYKDNLWVYTDNPKDNTADVKIIY